jgi:hypothetical protein
LMLGRARPGQPEKRFETGRQLTRRFENVQQVKKEFWNRWIEEIFPELLRQTKWTRDMRNVRVGDLVLRKDETAAGQTYKHPRVVKVHVGTDGRVRSADIEYRLPGETVYRTTTRPIHKLVMVIPVEEQTEKSNEEKTRIAGPDGQEPIAEGKTEAEGTESNGTSQTENVPENSPQGKKGIKGKPAQKVKHKKINSRRKLGKQTRTIVITVPKEKEEIKDIGVTAKRKRGRPRKTPGMEPLDPSKGSVLDPGKGVCANPGGRDATFGGGGPGPPVGAGELQLSPDRGGVKT